MSDFQELLTKISVYPYQMRKLGNQNLICKLFIKICLSFNVLVLLARRQILKQL